MTRNQKIAALNQLRGQQRQVIAETNFSLGQIAQAIGDLEKDLGFLPEPEQNAAQDDARDRAVSVANAAVA